MQYIFDWAKQFSNVCAILCGHDIPMAASDPAGTNFRCRVDAASDGHPLVSIYADFQLGAGVLARGMPIPNGIADRNDPDTACSYVILLTFGMDDPSVTISAINTTTGVLPGTLAQPNSGR